MLAALAVRVGAVRSTRARRLLVVGPVLTAAVAGFASLREAETYLPQVWIASAGQAGTAGELLDFFGDLRVVSTDRGLDLLLLAYAATVAVLLTRRVCGLLTVNRLLGKASAPAGHGYVVPVVHRLARMMDVPEPRVVLLPSCPGGAFTAGVRRPVIALDPDLLERLDQRELEGLLAHELAHVKRRDTVVGGAVGLVRDLTFFLPPVHVAVRWLRGEQEESADELASACTHRPAALASSILKVWDCSKGRGALSGSCAALGGGRRLATAGAGALDTGPALTDRARALTVRIERLIRQAPSLSRSRRHAEVVLATTVLLAASAAAIVLPRWVASDFDAGGLVIGRLGAVPAGPVESPAFTTFRRLTHPGATSALPTDSWQPAETACPCVESRAQLLARTPALGLPGSRGMLWASAGQDPWEVSTLREQALPARPLWTLNDDGPQLGLFVIGRPAG